MRRYVRRRAIAAIVATATLALVTVSAAAPATAAGPEVLLSDDGVHYGTSLSRGLFDGLGLLAPGESLTSALWIKNPSDDAASVRVSVGRLSVPSVSFGEDVVLTTVVPADATTLTTSLSQLQDCATLVPSRNLEAGAALRVDFTVTMAASTTGSANEAADLDFLIAMRDAVAGPFPISGCDTSFTQQSPATPTIPAGQSGPQGSGLAYTGVSPATFLFPVAGVLIGVGIFFWGRGRGRRGEREDT